MDFAEIKKVLQAAFPGATIRSTDDLTSDSFKCGDPDCDCTSKSEDELEQEVNEIFAQLRVPGLGRGVSLNPQELIGQMVRDSLTNLSTSQIILKYMESVVSAHLLRYELIKRTGGVDLAEQLAAEAVGRANKITARAR